MRARYKDRSEKSTNGVGMITPLHCYSSAGKEFQTRSPAVAKHRSPYVLCARRTTHDSELDDIHINTNSSSFKHRHSVTNVSIQQTWYLSLISVTCSWSQLELDASTTWLNARFSMLYVTTMCSRNASTVPTSKRPLQQQTARYSCNPL